MRLPEPSEEPRAFHATRTPLGRNGRLFQLRLALTAAVITLSSLGWADPSSLPPEVGHNYAEHETTRMTALGGAVRATGYSLTALYSNPANMAAAQLYHVGATAQIYPEAKRQSYGGGVVDSLISSTGMAGGLGATWTLQDPEGIDREWMDLRFGLAMPLGDIFFFGMTGKYITLQQNGVGPLGYSRASGGLEDKNIIDTITFDAGATLRPIPEFSIALTGHNLTNIDSGLLPIMGGLGIGFVTEDFGLSADAVLESEPYSKANLRIMGGGEFLAADRVAIRGGYRYDQELSSNAISGGLGYIDQRFSIDASFRRGVSGPAYTAIVFGFTVHIEAMGLGRGAPNSY